MQTTQVNRYIGAAKETIQFVDRKMDIGTTNKFFSNFWGLPARLACVSKQKEMIQHELRQEIPTLRYGSVEERQNAISKAEVETAASWGGFFGCGNCGVQSAMAFVRLRSYWKVFPLDWMQLKHGDHAFVVIGRDGRTDASNPSRWNDDVVLCDPWNAFAGRMREQSSLCRKELELMYRVDA